MEPKKLAAASGEFDPTTFKAASFDAYVGRFALNGAAGVEITFTREGDSLFTRLTGQRRIPIVPTSDSTFALRGVVASLTFDRDDTRAVKGVTLHQNGRDQYAPKLTGPAAEAWTPSVPALGEFTGRFFSEELETFYDMVVKDSSLVINQRRMDPNTLAPRAADTFFGSGVTIEFERDRNGRVIGFYASNGRTRGVRFARVR